MTAAAEADFQDILRWTAARFGAAQARAYAETLKSAFFDLGTGPDVSGAKKRDDIIKGLFTLHVARKGRKGRHFVMFRVASTRSDNVIEILRLLHDAMDLPRHLPADEDAPDKNQLPTEDTRRN